MIWRPRLIRKFDSCSVLSRARVEVKARRESLSVRVIRSAGDRSLDCLWTFGSLTNQKLRGEKLYLDSDRFSASEAFGRQLVEAALDAAARLLSFEFRPSRSPPLSLNYYLISDSRWRGFWLQPITKRGCESSPESLRKCRQILVISYFLNCTRSTILETIYNSTTTTFN